ncbi:MAG TPA: tripartite tricarboxylate transporter substrate-binding protein [Burkholderiales bacterium]|nr:tripartite tricarboxylate transporter substrate-binding protein [Burkholderiales bacterium]
MDLRAAFGAALAAVAASVSFPAAAQIAGAKPMRVLVPVPPGGPSDTAIRLILPRLSEGLGRTLVVDNRPGANGVAGTVLASQATPDGHTIAVGNSGTHAINASLYRKLPYDPVRDFAPIVQLVTSGMVLVANPKVPAGSLADFIAAARRSPGKFNVGIAGATGELSGEALWAQMQLRMNNVRYKGSAPTELAILGGEVDVAMLTPLATRSHIQSGKLKAFGITSAQRSPVLPEVPTIAEQGVVGYDFQIWHGLFAPRGTPERVIRAVNRAAVAALGVPEVRERFAGLGFVVIGNSPEEFAAVIGREVAKYRKIIADSGIEQL